MIYYLSLTLSPRLLCLLLHHFSAYLLSADLFTDLIDKSIQSLLAFVARKTAPHRYQVLVLLLLAHYQHIGQFGETRLSDLEADLLGTVVGSR